MIDDHARAGKSANERLEAGGVSRLKVQLHRQTVLGRHLPQLAQLRLAERGQPIGRVRMHADRDHVQPTGQIGHLLQRPGTVGEQQERALQDWPAFGRGQSHFRCAKIGTVPRPIPQGDSPIFAARELGQSPSDSLTSPLFFDSSQDKGVDAGVVSGRGGISIHGLKTQDVCPRADLHGAQHDRPGVDLG